MYRTITIIDGQVEMTSHDTYAEAAAFARDVAREGDECAVLRVLEVRGAVPEAESRPFAAACRADCGVRPGLDYPATFAGRRA